MLMCAHAAFVFEGVGFFDIAVALFTGRHEFLAGRCVRYSKRFAAMTPREVTHVLRERLKPIPNGHKPS